MHIEYCQMIIAEDKDPKKILCKTGCYGEKG